MSTISMHLRSLDDLYDPKKEFVYPIPRSILESHLPVGEGDPDSNIQNLFDEVMAQSPRREKQIVVVARDPRVGTTPLLSREGLVPRGNGRAHAYISPEVFYSRRESTGVCSGREMNEARAIAHLFAARLILGGYALYFDLQAAGCCVSRWFHFLKECGYKIKVLHFSAPDQVGRNYRATVPQAGGDTRKLYPNKITNCDLGFAEAAGPDHLVPGSCCHIEPFSDGDSGTLPLRLRDTFLQYADKIKFYYCGEAGQSAQVAARWLRNPPFLSAPGILEIYSNEGYRRIVEIHNAAIRCLGNRELYWESSMLASRKRKRPLPPSFLLAGKETFQNPSFTTLR